MELFLSGMLIVVYDMEVDPAKYVTLMDHPKLYMRSGPKNYFLSLLRRHTQKSLLLLSKSEMLSSLHS
jgi:hypothetical protein